MGLNLNTGKSSVVAEIDGHMMRLPLSLSNNQLHLTAPEPFPARVSLPIQSQGPGAKARGAGIVLAARA